MSQALLREIGSFVPGGRAVFGDLTALSLGDPAPARGRSRAEGVALGHPLLRVAECAQSLALLLRALRLHPAFALPQLTGAPINRGVPREQGLLAHELRVLGRNVIPLVGVVVQSVELTATAHTMISAWHRTRKQTKTDRGYRRPNDSASSFGASRTA